MSEIECFCRFNRGAKPSTKILVVDLLAQINSPHLNQDLQQSKIKLLLLTSAQELSDLLSCYVADMLLV